MVDVGRAERRDTVDITQSSDDTVTFHHGKDQGHEVGGRGDFNTLWRPSSSV
jgi:hypothetical protein